MLKPLPNFDLVLAIRSDGEEAAGCSGDGDLLSIVSRETSLGTSGEQGEEREGHEDSCVTGVNG